MSNLSLFLNTFGAYVIMFLVFVVCALVACFVGITMRKKKNAKDAVTNGEIAESEA